MTTATKQHLYTDILDEANTLLDDIYQYPISICTDKLKDMLIKLAQCKGRAATKLVYKLENILDTLQHSMNVIDRERLLIDIHRTRRISLNDSSEFFNIRYDSFLSQENVASLFHVHVKTVKRWDLGIGKPPTAVLIIMKTIAYGLHHFPGAGSQWEGWRIQNGVMYDPEAPRKHYHTTGTISAWFLVSQMLHHHEAKEYIRNKTISKNKNIQVFPGMDGDKWDKAITVLQTSLKKALKIEEKK